MNNKNKKYYVSPIDQKPLDIIICTNCPGRSILIATDNYKTIVCDHCNRTVAILSAAAVSQPSS